MWEECGKTVIKNKNTLIGMQCNGFLVLQMGFAESVEFIEMQ